MRFPHIPGFGRSAVMLAVLLAAAVVPKLDTGPAAEVYLTTPDGKDRLEHKGSVEFAEGAADIKLKPGNEQQSIMGFGASMTESSAHLISGLPDGERDDLMRDLFDSEGIGLDFLRQPVGASDFVAAEPFYTYDDSAEPDPELKKFSIERDEAEILPLLRQARDLNGDLAVIGSPWTAPAWMKNSNAIEGGRLRAEYYDVYADYLVKYLRAYDKAGIDVGYLTPQNEPQYGTTTYPSMRFSSSQQAEFVTVLDRKLSEAGLDTKLFIHDGNWDEWKYAVDILQRADGVSRVEGAAFHCYNGDPEDQEHIRNIDARVMLTECTGTSSESPSASFATGLRWQTENLLIRGLRAGSESVITWNVALDSSGGPHQGHCKERCRGLVEIDDGDVARNAGYYALGHLAKFVDRGARVVEVNQTSGMSTVAMVNPDGERVLLALNSSGETATLSAGEGDRAFEYELPAGAVATFTWPR